MNIRKLHLNRRTMLRGAGAAIALPLLDAMVPAGTALAQTAAAPKLRTAFIYFPHGQLMDRWTPDATGSDYVMKSNLAPLEPYRDYLTIVSGLRNKAGEGGGPHGIMAGTWLGCVHPLNGGGVSTDQILAQQIGQGTPFPSLELHTETGKNCDAALGCNYGNTISFRTPTQPLPMEYNPRKVFYQLFGQGDTQAEREAIAMETGSILDAVTSDAASLQARLGAADRSMVADYLDSVREIERRLQMVAEQDMSAMDLPDAPVGVPASFQEHLDLMYSFMALAYQADLTRVIAFMVAREVSMRSYPNLQVTDAFHPLSHHQEDPAKMDRLSRVQTFHNERFAKFIETLKTTPDGDGNLLDQSMILYGSNMSNSDRHNNDPLPSAILGKACGAIKGGQHLAYPQDTPHANLQLTLLRRAGLDIDTHGDEGTEELTEI
jgi:hypothetical protein